MYHVYAIRHPERDALQAFLHERAIGTNIHYPIPVHLQRNFAELGHTIGDFPHAEQAAHEVLSLPMYPELTFEQQDAVVAALRAWQPEDILPKDERRKTKDESHILRPSSFVMRPSSRQRSTP